MKIKKTEEEYRKIPVDSSSSLKEFSVDRKKYYKKYVLKEKVKEKYSSAATMGRIVETLLMEPELFDEKFYVSYCESSPTGLMLDFVEALYSVSEKNTDEFFKITKDFKEIAEEAYRISKFKLKLETVLEKFIGSDAEVYYKEIKKVRQNNLTVINLVEVSIAEKIVSKVKTNNTTKSIVNLVTSYNSTVINQMPVESYFIDGLELKSLLDKVIINHETKTITPYDLKCTWTVENFYEEYYLRRRAYIQAYLYYNAMVSLTLDTEAEYYGYSVNFLKFIVCDSSNHYNPLIYTLTSEDMNEAYEGFTNKGKIYPGVKEIIEGIKWAGDSKRWDISYKNHLSNGVINIKNDR